MKDVTKVHLHWMHEDLVFGDDILDDNVVCNGKVDEDIFRECLYQEMSGNDMNYHMTLSSAE